MRRAPLSSRALLYPTYPGSGSIRVFTRLGVRSNLPERHVLVYEGTADQTDQVRYFPLAIHSYHDKHAVPASYGYTFPN